MKASLVAAAATLLATVSAAPSPNLPGWGTTPGWSGSYNSIQCKLLLCDKLCYQYPSFWLWPIDSQCRYFGCQQDCGAGYPTTSPAPAQPQTVTKTVTVQGPTITQQGPAQTITKTATITQQAPAQTKTVTITKAGAGYTQTVTETCFITVTKTTAAPCPTKY